MSAESIPSLRLHLCRDPSAMKRTLQRMISISRVLASIISNPTDPFNVTRFINVISITLSLYNWQLDKIPIFSNILSWSLQPKIIESEIEKISEEIIGKPRKELYDWCYLKTFELKKQFKDILEAASQKLIPLLYDDSVMDSIKIPIELIIEYNAMFYTIVRIRYAIVLWSRYNTKSTDDELRDVTYIKNSMLIEFSKTTNPMDTMINIAIHAGFNNPAKCNNRVELDFSKYSDLEVVVPLKADAKVLLGREAVKINDMLMWMKEFNNDIAISELHNFLDSHLKTNPLNKILSVSLDIEGDVEDIEEKHSQIKKYKEIICMLMREFKKVQGLCYTKVRFFMKGKHIADAVINSSVKTADTMTPADIYE